MWKWGSLECVHEARIRYDDNDEDDDYICCDCVGDTAPSDYVNVSELLLGGYYWPCIDWEVYV